MFVFNWIRESVSELMSWLGFLPENSKILFLGLDNAGKTTLLHMLKDDRISTHNPVGGRVFTKSYRISPKKCSHD